MRWEKEVAEDRLNSDNKCARKYISMVQINLKTISALNELASSKV
jgi:hypothetical protein